MGLVVGVLALVACLGVLVPLALKETGATGSELRPLNLQFKFLNGTTSSQEKYVLEQVKILVPQIIDVSMTAKERQLAIHQWLIDNLEYDKSFKNIDAYSALTTGKTVCGGYATLYSVMLAEAGIESKIVTGRNIHNPSPLGHAWNLVKIEGKWYHADATWGDNEGREMYYYNKSDGDFDRKGYYWDKTQFPKATSSMMNPV